MHASPKNYLHAVRPTQIQIFPNDLLKELAPAHGARKYLGAADLHLPDGQAMPITGVTIVGSIMDLTEELWDKELDTNLKSIFLSMKHEINAMLAAGNGGAFSSSP